MDTLIVSFHRSNENPWKASDFSEEQLQILRKLAQYKTLILAVFVKPYALAPLERIEGINALLMSYQNSSQSQQLSADALFGAQALRGRLPVNVSESFQEGAGIDLSVPHRSGFASPASQGFDPKLLERVDELAQTAIDSMMTPGMRILVARKNKLFTIKILDIIHIKKHKLLVPMRYMIWLH